MLGKLWRAGMPALPAMTFTLYCKPLYNRGKPDLNRRNSHLDYSNIDSDCFNPSLVQSDSSLDCFNIS